MTLTFGNDFITWISGFAVARQAAVTIISSINYRPFSNSTDHVDLSLERVCLIVPLYEEVQSARASLNYFSSLIFEYPKLTIVFCGTARERINGKNPTIESILAYSTDSILVVECPHLSGGKAGQVNWVIDEISAARGADLIGVYDVDSRPDSAVLTQLNSHKISEDAEFYQQHSTFLTNLPKIKNPILRGQALYQTRWTFAHEVPRFSLYNKGLIPAVHLIGHGIFCSPKTIHDIGGFPISTANEDAHLGFYASVTKARLTSLVAMDHGDSPTTMRDSFFQNAGWSKGPLRGLKYALDYGKSGSLHKVSNTKLLLAAIFFQILWLQWAITSFYVGSLIFGVVSLNFFSILWLILYLFEINLNLYKANFRYKIYQRNMIWDSICILLFVLYTSIPVVYGFFDQIFNRKPVKYKTTHS